MSNRSIPNNNSTGQARWQQAEVAGAHNALPTPDDGKTRRKHSTSANKTGWRLFSEDVRRGRFFAVVGLAFIVAAAVSFATSPEYIVNGVTVTGSKVLSVEQANAIAGVQGQNIFTIDPATVQARLASQAALLKGVTVETELPNQVIISVQERRPAVVWVLGDGTPLLVSDDHVVVSNASTLDGFVTIFDRGPMTDSLKVGGTLPVQMSDAADTAQQIYLTLPQATGLKLRQLEYAPNDGISAVTVTDQRIEFGTGDNLEQKLKIVQAVVTQNSTGKAPWTTLDVRSVDRPVITR